MKRRQWAAERKKEEKSEVLAALKEIERSKASALDDFKREELVKLTAEREAMA